jgi:acyl-coenzyme A synthetase/AMP-(fatty) acid ligase
VAPGSAAEVPIPEIAVWSGDTARVDEDGFPYFVGRRDEMIKTPGYRVSPTEIEEVLYASDGVAEAVALGLPHPELGHGIVAVVRAADDALLPALLIQHCNQFLPNFMVPQKVVIQETLPKNPNGKINRKLLATELGEMFQSGA